MHCAVISETEQKLHQKITLLCENVMIIMSLGNRFRHDLFLNKTPTNDRLIGNQTFLRIGTPKRGYKNSLHKLL